MSAFPAGTSAAHDDDGFADLVLCSSAPQGSLDGIRRLNGSQHRPAPVQPCGTPFAAEREQVQQEQGRGSVDKVRPWVPMPPHQPLNGTAPLLRSSRARHLPAGSCKPLAGTGQSSCLPGKRRLLRLSETVALHTQKHAIACLWATAALAALNARCPCLRARLAGSHSNLCPSAGSCCFPHVARGACASHQGALRPLSAADHRGRPSSLGIEADLQEPSGGAALPEMVCRASGQGELGLHRPPVL